MSDATNRRMANAIRALAMDAVQAANSGHPGMPMGMADAATVLFREQLRFDPADPAWPDRDRFVLSAGHGSMLIYALLHLTGYARPTLDDIRNFRQIGSPCAGHPESFELPGIECTTGPLGQGFAMAVGMALAERHLNADFGDDLVDHRTWVIAGDGCLQEGVSHEAAGLAGHLKLGRLNVLWDDNRISIDGPTSLSTSDDVLARFRAHNWHVTSCDGHDAADVSRALAEAAADPRPSLIACRTTIGYGAPTKAGTAGSHGSPLGASEIAGAREALGWTAEPFAIPHDILSDWRALAAKGAEAHAAWESRRAAHPRGAEFAARMSGDAPDTSALQSYLAQLLANPANVATRKSSEMALEPLTASIPALVGGSADLTGSNNTKTKATAPLTADDYSGRYIYYGIREFGMAAAMNGMALHGGIIPYGGTFLVFSDYMRGAIRLSALQGAHVIYVLTHDSIGLGEDGPTHQPVEHLASLRAMPNLAVYRPADAIETAEAWACALADTHRPSVLALSRQNLPQVRTDATENMVMRGIYRLRAAVAPRRVVLAATGSEVTIALDAATRLEAQGIGVDVVSVPCWERATPEAIADLMPRDALRVSLEAAAHFGWGRIVGADALMIGLDAWGASGPIDELYRHFGLDAESVAKKITQALEKRP